MHDPRNALGPSADGTRRDWVSNRIASGLLIGPGSGGVGTLGCIVYDMGTLEPRALTVAHLFARLGEAVYYPDYMHDQAHQLGQVIWMDTDWDLALFSLVNPARPLFQGLVQQNNIGAIPNGVTLRKYLNDGMGLGKMGGISGYTSGTIQHCGPNTMPSNPTPKNWREFFCIYPSADHIVLSRPGDSGALWFGDTTLFACGVHQSGDPNANVAVAIPIDPVLESGGVFLDHGLSYLKVAANWISGDQSAGDNGVITLTCIGPDLRLNMMQAGYLLLYGRFELSAWNAPTSAPLPSPGLAGSCGVFVEYLSIQYLFVRDRLGHFLMYQAIGSSNWITLSGVITSDPAVSTYYVDGNAMIFACARNRQGGLSYAYSALPATSAGGWSNLISAPALPDGLSIVGAPTIARADGAAQLQIFVRALDNAIYYIVFDCKSGFQQPWAAITDRGVAGSSPCAGSVQTPGSGTVAPTYVYYRSIDCRVQQSRSVSGAASDFQNNWRSIAVNSRPIFDLAVAFTPSTHVLFFETPDGLQTVAVTVSSNVIFGPFTSIDRSVLIDYQALPNVVWSAFDVGHFTGRLRQRFIRRPLSLLRSVARRLAAWIRKARSGAGF